MKMEKTWLTVICILSFLLFFNRTASTQPVDTVPEKSRCPVCGMFVAKYPDWIAQIVVGGQTYFFDGTKDMYVYFLDPGQFDGPSQSDMKEIWVKDYYTLDWLDGRKAYYVIGSDVYGPMGHELIPFSSAEAAESFKTDHKGKSILRFDEVTSELIESMRHGQKMR